MSKMKKWQIAKYQTNSGNPLIDALPLLITGDQLMEMEYTPEVTEEERNLAAEERIQRLQRTREMFLVRPEMKRVGTKLDMLIRQAYLGRNPMNEEQADLGETAQSFLFSGVYGIGKRTLIRHLCDLYPEVICHQCYQGKIFHALQIPILRVCIPMDGGVAALCQKMVDQMVQMTGTDTVEGRGSARKENGYDTLIRLIQEYHVGCVIVEQMDFTDFSGKDQEKILRFLQGMQRETNVSILIVCSESSADSLFVNSERSMAFTSANDLKYLPYEQGEEWDRFVDTLWGMQWVKNPVEKTVEMMETLYQWSRGITEVVIRAWIAVQEETLSHERERWDIHDMNRACREALRNIQPYLSEIDAIHPQDLESALDGVHL